MNLFQEDEIDYSSGTFPTLREFQATAHEALRQGDRDGHRCQLVMAPTGAGKTILAMNIIQQALIKGKRCMFVCDRKSLIEQASEVADALGLSQHGIIASNHWRTNLKLPFQIASVQTLMRRSWPDMDVIVCDEAHTQFKTSIEHFQRTTARVIGLSATPFSSGLGKVYTNLINSTTMHALTESGILVPMRIFSCHKMDMTGAETSGGEWTDKAAGERALQIKGDVVADWAKYALDRKTIGFFPDIATTEQYTAEFKAAGYRAETFTSHTTDNERAELLAEYRKSHSSIRLLLSVEALAKGFDVPDIGCLAEGSMILTRRGLIAIDKLLLSDTIWDGIQFVAHGGAVYKGEQNVITYAGLTATPDHQVKTAQGWCSFGECASKQIPIRKTGFGWSAIYESENIFSNNNLGWAYAAQEKNDKIGMCGMWEKIRSQIRSFSFWSHKRLRGLPEKETNSTVVDCQSQKPESPMREQQPQSISRLRGAWNRISFCFTKSSSRMDNRKLGDSPTEQEHTTGQDKQRRTLRAGEPSLDFKNDELLQHSTGWLGGEDAQVQTGTPRNTICRQDVEESIFNGNDRGTNNREIQQTIGQTKRRVWDILNAGPRNCFTCEGLLVHNCGIDARPFRKSLSGVIQMWGRILRSHPGKEDAFLLDFSGNIVRFIDDYTEIFYNGLEALDMGEKLDKAIRREDEEKEPSKCPKCGATPCGKKCLSCGYERPAKQSTVEVQAGIMTEIVLGGKKLADDSRHLYEQLCTYHRYNGGKIETAAGRVWHQFQQITGQKPPQKWNFDSTPDVKITKNVIGKIKSMKIAWRKSLDKQKSSSGQLSL